MLPGPVFYLLSELLLFLRHFLDLGDAFLRVFSSLSTFLLNWVKDCLVGLAFLPGVLAVQKSAFTATSFLYLQQSLVERIVCAPPCFFHRSQCFSKQTFLGTLVLDPVLGCLDPVLLLMEAFLLDDALAFSCVHMRSIASREGRSKHMSTGVMSFLWSMYWSCQACGHIQRT
jgi:hypothetical protein